MNRPLLLLLAPVALAAQQVRGTVRDSATRQPVRGAVLVVLDSAGANLRRLISDERGNYRLTLPAGARTVRVFHIGFRPASLPLLGESEVDVVLAPITRLLDAVTVTAAASCAPRGDRARAFAVLEQARLGLLATVVARETSPPTLTTLTFERVLRPGSSRIEEQAVHTKVGSASTSFAAARTAAHLVTHGFGTDSAGHRIFYAPDADVLLSDAFTIGYCFSVADRDRQRGNQIGVSFAPAERRPDRVDIDGTFWIDTSAWRLRDLEFRYVGLPRATETLRPGGRLSFRELPNGIVFIDAWSIRFFRENTETVLDTYQRPVDRTWISAHEHGGEVAEGLWPDSTTYRAKLGTLWLRAVDATGKPVSSAVLRLENTDYIASPDARGLLEITGLLPGPYTGTVLDSGLASAGIVLPTSLKFEAERDKIYQTRVRMPTAGEYVRVACGKKRLDGRPVGSGDVVKVRRADDPEAWMTGRVLDAGDRGVAGVHWLLRRNVGTDWQVVSQAGLTGPDGQIETCIQLMEDDVIELSAWREGQAPTTSRATLRAGMQVLTVRLP